MLSVIIPVYNVEEYLCKCLDSVINQTFKDLQIICVDDGSSDCSIQILNCYKKRDSRITVICNDTNKGLVATRKMGLLLADGEYTTYVDSDDWIDENMYEEMMRCVAITNADVVTSGFIREYGNTSKKSDEGIEKGIYKGDTLQYYYSHFIGTTHFFEFNVPGSLSNKLMRTSMLKEFQLCVSNRIVMGEDAAVSYPMLLHANCIAVMGKNYYHYRIHRNSITGKTHNSDHSSLLILFQYMEDRCSKLILDFPGLKKQIKLWEYYIVLCEYPDLIVSIKDDQIFPYMNVCINEKIITYGMGRFGTYVDSYLRKKDVNIVANIDARYDNISIVNQIEYDKVIITALRADEIEQIYQTLILNGVEEGKIKRIEIDQLLKQDVKSLLS